MNRREYLKLLLGLISAGAGNGRLNASALAEVFTFSQIKYTGDWNPDPSAARNLLERVSSWTSILVDKRFPDFRQPIDLLQDNMFDYPFLYLTGHYEFPDFPEAVIHKLRVFLNSGGMLVADDCAGTTGLGFDKSVRRLLAAIFPGKPFLPLPADHTLFQSFFLIQDFRFGRRIVTRSVEGIEVGDITPVLYFRNDLGCAFEHENNRWVHTCVPFGEIQRTLAFKMGINIVMYALCGNYKKDQIHLPSILQKRGRR